MKTLTKRCNYLSAIKLLFIKFGCITIHELISSTVIDTILDDWKVKEKKGSRRQKGEIKAAIVAIISLSITKMEILSAKKDHLTYQFTLCKNTFLKKLMKNYTQIQTSL